MVAYPASKHRHDPLGRNHLRLHLQALHEMCMQRGQVLLQELLQREVLQMVLIHLLHVEALQLLFENERNHAFERHLLGLVRIVGAASHYLIENDRNVIDALAVACLREDLRAHCVEDPQVRQHVFVRDGHRRVSAQRVLRSEEIDVYLAYKVILALCHAADMLWPVRIGADLDAVDLSDYFLIGPLAYEVVYPLVALQQGLLPNARPETRPVGEMAVEVPNLEQVL